MRLRTRRLTASSLSRASALPSLPTPRAGPPTAVAATMRPPSATPPLLPAPPSPSTLRLGASCSNVRSSPPPRPRRRLTPYPSVAPLPGPRSSPPPPPSSSSSVPSCGRLLPPPSTTCEFATRASSPSRPMASAPAPRPEHVVATPSPRPSSSTWSPPPHSLRAARVLGGEPLWGSSPTPGLAALAPPQGCQDRGAGQHGAPSSSLSPGSPSPSPGLPSGRPLLGPAPRFTGLPCRGL
jgi:hypothetical protein